MDVFEGKNKRYRKQFSKLGDNIEDNTWVRVHMEFFFRVLNLISQEGAQSTSESKVEHKKRNSISKSDHVSFFLLYKHTKNDFFDDFLTISEHFSEISKYSPKVIRRPDKLIPNIFHFPKIAEDFQIFLRKNRSCFDNRVGRRSTF